MQIGEPARACNLTPKTIRHYEAFGLLPYASRAPSGHRIYSAQDLLRLRFIGRDQFRPRRGEDGQGGQHSTGRPPARTLECERVT